MNRTGLRSGAGWRSSRAPSTWALAASVALVLLAACSPRAAPVIELTGATMGTRYSIQLAGPVSGALRSQVAQRVDEDLVLLNGLLSNWDEQSELSRFNQSRDTDWFPVSEHTARVVALALAVGASSGGALDPTVAPLVERWGFGPTGNGEVADAPAALGDRVGLKLVQARIQPPALRKARSDVALDLSAVAKGYAVDYLLARLRHLGLDNLLVEIGGEVVAHGAGPAGRGWRIGIENPLASGVLHVLTLENAAVATSGDYRNYRQIDGERVTHLIDPRSGKPIDHALASVTVVAESAAKADAWATALAVLGRREGLALAEKENLAVWFAERVMDERGSATLREATSNSMDRRLSRPIAVRGAPRNP